jgi:hypothetical protein
LRTAAVRRAARAPELERYLDRAQVDLAVTDQIEALQVRVQRGLEVLERKAAEGSAMARRLIASQGIRSGVFAAAAAVLGFKLPPDQPLLWAVLGLLALRVIAGLVWVVRARNDRAALRRLAESARGGLEGASSAEQVLAFGQRTLEAARALGMCAAAEE